MILKGTLINVLAIFFGTLVGRYLGRFIPERVRRTIMMGLGLAVILIGIQLAIQSRNPLIVIGAMLIGGIVGETLAIEERLDNMGHRLQARFKDAGSVAEAFVTASLLYCIGAMAVMGSIQDGLGQEPTILYAKSALDGIASIALASTLGIGVIFSIIPLIVYQGGITLAAVWVQEILTDPVVAEMNATGGLLIVAIGLDILQIRKLPVGNLLPAIFAAAGIAWALG
ncbi:MAG: DUF554 domain-containing protein [Proteobacteria bacterium]|nr:DUF554 domain-containing protein [Pseudomonadota bacterium]